MRIRGVGAVLAVLVALALSASAAAAPLKTVDRHGVPGLRLGMTAKHLREAGKIGPLRPGCELAPSQKIARLRPPLRGFAIFNHRVRKLSALSFSGGVETARGIHVGSTAADARAAYPRAEYQAPGTADPFAEGFLWVNTIEHPAMTFVVDPDSNRVETIAVHFPAFCE